MGKQAAGLCALVCVQGCAAVPLTPVYSEGEGQFFCARLEEGARDMSTANATGGWTFAGGSLGAVAAGGIVTGVNVQEKDQALGIVGLALIAGGALLAPAAQALFTRSDAANILAESANLGILKKDREAYDHCTTAKGQWIRSRADANNFAVIMLNDQVRKEEERKKELKEAEDKANQATQEKLAIEAKTKADADARAKAEADAKAKEEEDKRAKAAEARAAEEKKDKGKGRGAVPQPAGGGR